MTIIVDYDYSPNNHGTFFVNATSSFLRRSGEFDGFDCVCSRRQYNNITRCRPFSLMPHACPAPPNRWKTTAIFERTPSRRKTGLLPILFERFIFMSSQKDEKRWETSEQVLLSTGRRSLMPDSWPPLGQGSRQVPCFCFSPKKWRLLLSRRKRIFADVITLDPSRLRFHARSTS